MVLVFGPDFGESAFGGKLSAGTPGDVEGIAGTFAPVIRVRTATFLPGTASGTSVSRGLGLLLLKVGLLCCFHGFLLC